MMMENGESDLRELLIFVFSVVILGYGRQSNLAEVSISHVTIYDNCDGDLAFLVYSCSRGKRADRVANQRNARAVRCKRMAIVRKNR